MDIFEYNNGWMLYNLGLAALPLLFCRLFFAFKNIFIKYIFFSLWVLYLPNAIYIFLDLSHLIEVWDYVEGIERMIVIAQYIVFEVVGLALFLLSLASFEKALMRTKWVKSKQIKYALLIGYNFLLGFAMVLGRIERVNSWEVFVAPQRVLAAMVHILMVGEFVGFILLLGIFTNCFYFLFRKPFLK